MLLRPLKRMAVLCFTCGCRELQLASGQTRAPLRRPHLPFRTGDPNSRQLGSTRPCPRDRVGTPRTQRSHQVSRRYRRTGRRLALRDSRLPSTICRDAKTSPNNISGSGGRARASEHSSPRPSRSSAPGAPDSAIWRLAPGIRVPQRDPQPGTAQDRRDIIHLEMSDQVSLARRLGAHFRCRTMFRTLPSGARTKKRRTPQGSSCRG